jgi:beta-phosphoglucomutase-like phosphatase (HAD superfamily)
MASGGERDQPAPVKAVLFDMDGLLIDSERIYTAVTNEILAEHGKGPLPMEIKLQMMGEERFTFAISYSSRSTRASGSLSNISTG